MTAALALALVVAKAKAAYAAAGVVGHWLYLRIKNAVLKLEVRVKADVKAVEQAVSNVEKKV